MVFDPLVLWRIDFEKIKDSLTGYHSVRIENEDVVLHRKSISINAPIWELCYRLNIAPKKEYLIDSHLKGDFLDENAINEAMFRIVRYYFRNIEYRLQEADFFEALMEAKSALYNNSFYIEEYGLSVDIVDAVMIQKDKDITASIEAIYTDHSPEAVETSRRTVDKLMLTRYADTPLGIAYRSNSINREQFQQSVGPLGYRQNLSNIVLSKPIATSYVLGAMDLHTIVADAYTNIKAQMTKNGAIAKSEDFGKRMKLLMMFMNKIIPGDCGSQSYVEIKLVDNSDTVSGNIDSLQGNWFLFKNQQLELFESDQWRGHGGKVLKFRLPASCKSPNPRHICSTCFGELSDNVPEDSNIGVYCAQYFVKYVTQFILKTKHFVGSSKLEKHILDETANYVFYIANGTLFFRPEIFNLDEYNYHLHVRIKDMKLFENYNNRDESTYSNISTIMLVSTHMNTGKTEKIKLSLATSKTKNLHFSVYMLRMMAKYGNIITANSTTYKIYLNNILTNNIKIPVLIFPNLGMTYETVPDELSAMLISAASTNMSKDDLTRELHAFLSQKMYIPFSIVSTLVKSLYVVDHEKPILTNEEGGVIGNYKRKLHMSNIYVSMVLGQLNSFLASSFSYNNWKDPHPTEDMLLK